MKFQSLAAIFFFGCFMFVSADVLAEQDTNNKVKLSPELLSLLRMEMTEISIGVQSIPLALATADWASIQETSARINASYIMEKSLTPAQAGELESALPEYFKQLDAEFHNRAVKLGEAAEVHDFELAAFHYSRLVESCARCHSAFASQRFSGFADPMDRVHHH
jgi:hypothetical protein